MPVLNWLGHVEASLKEDLQVRGEANNPYWKKNHGVGESTKATKAKELHLLLASDNRSSVEKIENRLRVFFIRYWFVHKECCLRLRNG